MANVTINDVDAAMSSAVTLGDRLVALVSLRKRALADRQTALNKWKAGTLTEVECEALQGAAQAVLSVINSNRIGVEALIQ